MRSSIVHSLCSVTALFVISQPLAAQRNTAESDDSWLQNCRRAWSRDDDSRACEVRSVPVRLSGRAIEVDGRDNGSVRVTAWDGDSVRVTARVATYARDDAAARDLLKEVRISADGKRISSAGPRGGRNEHWSVSYQLWVPRRFDLRLDSHNGSVSVTGVTGKLDLDTENGSMNLTDVGGDVRARTQNGSLNVQLAGSRWDGAGLNAETQNGSVHLAIPASYAALIETETVNGRMSTDFPVTLQGRIGRHLSLPLNGGGATLRVTTTNGSVSLARR